MAECVKNAFDFIKSAFPIRVGVICSQDADILSQKNNLSFSELIQPFCVLTNETHVQGIGNQVSRAFNVHIKVSDVAQNLSTTNENAVKQLLTDLVQKSLPNDNSLNQTVAINSRGYDLEVNKSCAWFDVYRDLSIRYGKLQEHEFLNHHIACMLVVSSLHPSPLDEFVKLSQQQNLIQHNSKDQCSSVRWMTPNTLKCYILLHDVHQGNSAKAKAVYSDLQALYGMKVCYLLEINSKDDSQNDAELNLPDPWTKHMSYSAHNSVNENVNDSLIEVAVNGIDNGWLTDLENVVSSNPKKGFGCCLTLSDHDKLRMFVQQFITQGIIPYLGKTIKTLHEQVNSRKTIHRSFFRATRTLFGSKSTGSLSSVSASYSQEANELNIRKLGDICFLLQMYEQAFHYYHTAKKDYTNDQAWLFAAGASEMAALSNFMQTNIQKGYPIHYMENAYNIYSDICKNDFLSLRCTLLHTACLQTKGLFSEAAFYFVKMTDEIDDLRSALLLEQAAHCYLKMKLPLPRKFAFHAILAGHRFGKCLQRRHALRCYSQALQIIDQRGWHIAQDHINFTVARQSFNLRQIEIAVNSFRKILEQKSYKPNSQQASIFEEFIHVFKQYIQEKSGPEDKSEHNAFLTLPRLQHEDVHTVVVNPNAQGGPIEHSRILEEKSLNLANISFQQVIKSDEIPKLLNIGNCFTEFTDNTTNPLVTVNESFKIVVTFENILNIKIVLTNIELVWKIDSEKNVTVQDIVKCEPINLKQFNPLSKEKIIFTVTPLQVASLSAVAVKYNVGSGEVNENSATETFYSVQDRQEFQIRGPRLNSNKNEKYGQMYGVDNRLNIKVNSSLPRLNISFSQFSDMIVHEICEATLTLNNVGTEEIMGVQLRTADEFAYVIKEDTRDDYIVIDKNSSIDGYKNILHSPLPRNESVTFKCWVKAHTNGEHRADLLLHYFINRKETDFKLHRFNWIEVCLKVNPGFSVLKDILHTNTSNSHMVTIAMKSNQENYMDFVLEKPICPNKEWNLKDITGSQESCAISPGQAFTSYLQMVKEYSEAKINIPQHYLMLSGVCNNYPSILLLWHTNEDTVRFGMTSLHFKELGEKQIKEVEAEDENMKKLLHWSLKLNSPISHNFTKCSLCYVPIDLCMFNMTGHQLDITLSLSKHSNGYSPSNRVSHTPFSWLGHTTACYSLLPFESKTLTFTACFKSSGVYNINSVKLLASYTNVTDTDQLKVLQEQSSEYFLTINKS